MVLVVVVVVEVVDSSCSVCVLGMHMTAVIALYRKHNLVSLFLGFTTTISVHNTVIRASITVLEFYHLSLSEYS